MSSKKPQSPPYDSFYWTDTDEPHAKRRKDMLAKYPQLKQLMGVYPALKYILLSAFLAQVTVAYLVSRYASSVSWPAYLLLLTVFGAPTNHFFMMGIHELSHNTAFHRPIYNKLFSILINVPVLLPYSIAFRWYHAHHHKYQGEDGIDVDLPTEREGRLFQSTPFKFVYFFLQAFFYVIRPLYVHPKPQTPLEIAQTIFTYACAILWYIYLGPAGLLYLVSCTLLGTSIHPVAAHFFAEHYVYVPMHETYSYYGVLNYVNINVGYHTEHHDFPSICGFRLPLVRAIASEFYDDMPTHNSWVGVQWQFVLNPKLTAFCRVKRKNLHENDRVKLKSS